MPKLFQVWVGSLRYEHSLRPCFIPIWSPALLSKGVTGQHIHTSHVCGQRLQGCSAETAGPGAAQVACDPLGALRGSGGPLLLRCGQLY